MDSAETSQLAAAIRTQKVRFAHQEEFQMDLASQMGQLSSQVRDLVEHLRQAIIPSNDSEPPVTTATTVPAALVTGAGIKLAALERYSEEPFS